MPGWAVRHEGSPQFVDGLSPQEIAEGIRDGLWEPSDEVRGQNETQWQSLESHPVFAEALSGYEPPPPSVPDDETRLDMNPLIDVALVLLIFFILTTTYEELRKKLPVPSGVPEEVKKGLSEGELKQVSFRLTIAWDGTAPVYRIEDRVVDASGLQKEMEAEIRKTGRTKLAVEVDPKIPWKAFVAVQDAAAGANISEVIRVVRKNRVEVEEK